MFIAGRVLLGGGLTMQGTMAPPLIAELCHPVRFFCMQNGDTKTEPQSPPLVRSAYRDFVPLLLECIFACTTWEAQQRLGCVTECFLSIPNGRGESHAWYK